MANNNLNVKLGKGDQAIKQWLDLQANKSWAVKFLVKKAIAHYGMNDVQTVLEGSTLPQPARNVNAVLNTEKSNDAQKQDDLSKVTDSFTF